MRFDPDWVVHPGATLADWLDEHDVDDGEALARQYGILPVELRGYLDGSVPISRAGARRLEAMTGAPRTFWRRRERTFREGLAAGKTWTRAVPRAS